jgi:hypothetical protein
MPRRRTLLCRFASSHSNPIPYCMYKLSALSSIFPESFNQGSCTCALRIIQMDLSGAGCVTRINQSWALPSGFQGRIQPPSLVCGHTGPALSYEDPPRQPLIWRAAVATAGRGTAALHATSRRDPSGQRPSQASEAAIAWPNRSHGSARGVASSGVRRHAASKSCGTSDTRPTAGASYPRLCTA